MSRYQTLNNTPSSLSANHVNHVMARKKSVYCLGAAAFNLLARELRSLAPLKNNLKFFRF